MTKLQHVAQINPSTPEFDRLPRDAAIPFVPLEAVWSVGLDLSRRRPRAQVESGYTRFREGDIVLPKITPTFQADRTTIARGLDGGVAAGTTELHVVRVSTESEPRYIRYLLSSLPFLQGGAAEMIGVAGQKRVPEDWLRRQEVFVTSRVRQAAIADFLDAETARIDAVLAAKARLAASLDERLRAARDSRFAALTAPRAPLGRFVLSLTQGVSPQAGERPAEVGERGLLKLSAVKRGSFVDGENKVLDPGVVDGAMTVARDDLLVTRSNTPSYVGDACWVPDNFPHLVICDLIYRLRLDQRLRPDFAAQVLVSEAGHGELSSLARGTSQSMVKLRGEDIKSVRVPIPAVEDQIKFMTVVNSMRAAHEAIHGKLRMQSAALQEHRQALITAAVTGELTIPGAA